MRHRWTGTAPPDVGDTEGLSRIAFFLSMVVRAIYHVGVEEDCGRSRPGREFKVADEENETREPRKARET